VRVVVIGAGVGGTAAAWAARRAGARVTVVHAAGGASALTSGAADFDPWERAVVVHALSAEERELCEELGCVAGQSPCRVATAAGVLRAARARDAAVLELDGLAGKRIAVADLVADGWDAVLVARALSASAWAVETGTRFEPRALALGDVRGWPSWDIAARFDDDEQAESLGQKLAKGRSEADAWLLGPWLGTRPGVAEKVRSAANMPVGEALSPPGGAAGARFESARDALFARLELEVRRARVSRLVEASGALELQLDTGERLGADRVVLALGGVAAGGVLVDPARPEHPGGACFHPSLQAPVSMQIDGLPVDAVSSLHGVDLASLGVGLLESVGVATDGPAARGARGIFVAGDLVADRPRTLLRALATGIAAGTAAAG
jgi:glycerol-3-phosphate dehydrogenase subunit B